MNILMAIEPSGGGTGRHVLDLCRGLSARGHRVLLAYSPLRAEALFLEQIAAFGIEAVPVAMHRAVGPADVASGRALARLIAERGPFDILHGHSAKAGALLRCIPAGRASTVYTPHAFRSLDPEARWLSRSGYLAIEKLLGLRTDALIAVSQAELDFAVCHRIAPGRQHLIHNGLFDLPAIDREQVRADLGFAPDDIVAGFVGRLSYQKAPERFIEAMVAAFKADGRLRALLIGDGELRDDTLRRIAESGYADRFKTLIGVDAKLYIGALDLLMLTSRYEGFSYVMLEALAAGVPLISTPVGGVDEAIGDAGCGIIVPDLDQPEQLTEAVTALIAQDGRLADMQAKARLRGEAFSGDRMIDRTEAVYAAIRG